MPQPTQPSRQPAAAAAQPVAPPRPGPPPSGYPSAGGGPAGGASRRPSRKVLVIAGVALVAVLGGTGVGIAYSRGGTDPSAGPSLSTVPVPTPSTSAPVPTPTPTPTPTIAALPQSRALTETELVVPMQLNGSWNLYLGSSDSNRPGPQLTQEPGNNSFPVLSPDFKTVVYAHDDGEDTARTLRVAGAADGQGDRALFARQPSQCAQYVKRPAWNPADPTMLAMPCTDASGRQGVYEFRTDGTLIRQIDTGDNRAFGDTAISPDGKTLVFWASPNDKYDGGTLVAAPVDGSAPAQRLLATTMPGQDADPAFSPDGASMAFRRRGGTAADRGDSNVWVVAAAPGSRPKQLTRDKAEEQDPVWSRSGQQLAYKSAEPSDDFTGKVPRIRVMNADGSDSEVLWTSGKTGEQTAAAWARR